MSLRPHRKTLFGKACALATHRAGANGAVSSAVTCGGQVPWLQCFDYFLIFSVTVLSHSKKLCVCVCVCVCMFSSAAEVHFLYLFCCLVTKLCPTLCDPTDCSQPGSSVCGILQVRILERVAISFSRGSS